MVEEKKQVRYFEVDVVFFLSQIQTVALYFIVLGKRY